MCSIPTAAERAGRWFFTNIADNDDAPGLSSSASSTTSTVGSFMSSKRWQPWATKHGKMPRKPATKRSWRARSIPVDTDAAEPWQSHSPNNGNHGVDFLPPECETLRSLKAIAADPNTRTSSDDAEGVRAAKYREQHIQIERIIANSEKLDRQIRQAIAEAMDTPITNLKPGDIEKDDWLLIDKVRNELLIRTEDGWYLVDDEIPGMSSWRV